MSLKKENNQKPAEKPVVKPWMDDPYPARSEEFYREAYKGGKCKYCGKVIKNDLDVCNCPKLVAARNDFKRRVREQAGYTPKTSPAQDLRPYDPNKHIEPKEIDDVPF